MTDASSAGNTDESVPKNDRIFRVINRIPIFRDLTPKHVKLILSRAQKRTLTEGEQLCEQGGKASSLFILLQGKLAVRIKKSSAIATINPVSSIGELGVFTEQPRNATVLAMESSHVLELKKDDIDAMMEQDPVMGMQIMRNVIRELAQRIADDNIKLREYQNFIIDQIEKEPTDQSG